MDEEVGDEVTAIEAIDGMHFHSKESHSLKPGSSDMLELHEMVIPGEGDDEKSPNLFTDVLDGKNLDRIGASGHACTSPRCMDDVGVMVEELTVRSYNSENLAVVGTSNNRDKMQIRQNQWQHLYQISGGSRSGSSDGDAAYRDNGGTMPSVWDDVGYTIFPELLDKKQPSDNHNEKMENLTSSENKPDSSTTLLSPRGIRTKILSKSGFSEYFVKNTLKGKGVICRGPVRKGFGVEFGDQTKQKAAGVSMVDSDASLNSSGETVVPPLRGIAEPWPGLCPGPPGAYHDGVTLREWLKAGQNKASKVKRLYIFRQIVDLVDFSHSRGVALRDLWPSSFKLLPSNQIMYLGSSVPKEIVGNIRNQDLHHSENINRNEKRPLEQGIFPIVNQSAKKRKFGENTNFIRRWPQFPVRSGIKPAAASDANVEIAGPQYSGNKFNEEHTPKTEYKTQRKSSSAHVSNTSQLLLTSGSDPLEEKWYTSSEELSERCCTFSSNIYSLGVLLFERLNRQQHCCDLYGLFLPVSWLF